MMEEDLCDAQPIVQHQATATPVATEMEALDAAGAPASKVRLPEEVADDPQLEALGLMLEIEHDLTGPERMVGSLVEMSETSTGANIAAPPLGRDTVEVLSEAGFGPEEIAALNVASR